MEAINNELLDYYHGYCELTIWFKKIVATRVNATGLDTKDMADDFVAERNRILQYVPAQQRKKFKSALDKILKSYCYKVAKWTTPQKKAHDMV